MEDYVEWQGEDKKTVKRINKLLKDIERNVYTGIGKPEPLKCEFTGWWSRRIDDVNKLLYRALDDGIEVMQCRYPMGREGSSVDRKVINRHNIQKTPNLLVTNGLEFAIIGFIIFRNIAERSSGRCCADIAGQGWSRRQGG